MKNNIKSAREKAKLTQQECADIFGVTIRAWQTYEQGVSEPKFEVLCKIADYFCVTTDYLLGREPINDPYAELRLKKDDEKAVIDKFMSLPESFRAVALQLLRELSSAIEREPAPNITLNERPESVGAARSSERDFIPLPTEAEENAAEAITDDYF